MLLCFVALLPLNLAFYLLLLVGSCVLGLDPRILHFNPSCQFVVNVLDSCFYGWIRVGVLVCNYVITILTHSILVSSASSASIVWIQSRILPCFIYFLEYVLDLTCMFIDSMYVLLSSQHVHCYVMLVLWFANWTNPGRS